MICTNLVHLFDDLFSAMNLKTFRYNEGRYGESAV